jgi:hypothetical protein
MKIINHGNTYKSDKDLEFERFKCEKCKCEFNALEDEYYRDYEGAETSNGESWTYTTITINVPKTVKDYLVCSCPECHKIIKKVKERRIQCQYSEPPTINYVSGVSRTNVTSKEVLDTEVSS